MKFFIAPYRRVLEPSAMIALAVFLFIAAYNIEVESTTDRVLVPACYVCSGLCLLAAIIGFLPTGEKVRRQQSEIRQQEKEATRDKIATGTKIWNLALRRVVSHELPAVFAMAIVYAFGILSSLPTILTVLAVAILIDFIITYYYLAALKKIASS